jgi:hypothetical protein
MRNTIHIIMFGSVLAFSFASTVHADDLLDKVYMTVNGGFANSNTDIDSVQRAFDQKGLNATIQSVDDTRHGFGLGVGYEITPEWSAELNYLDLEQVEVKFSSTQAINTLEKIHPESGEGVTLSGLYRHALGDKAHVRVRAGFFNWGADYKTTSDPGNPNGTDSDSGTDFYWGVGFGYQLSKSLKLTTEMQRFEFSNDKTEYVQLGIEWRFVK